MEIVLDADRNQEYLKKHGDELEQHKTTDDGFVESTNSSRKIREVYIPPDEVSKLLDMYSHVVVQDFEDEYHMSKEERTAMQEKFKKFFRLKRGFTKKIRKLDKFIEACRLCMEIIDDTAQSNGIYDPDKFKMMVLKGEISINGLNFPKFQGKKKKKLNWEYIAEYVLDSSKDISDLMTDKKDQESTISPRDMYTDEELERIFSPVDEKTAEIMKIPISDTENLGNMVASTITKKDRKDLIKVFPAFISCMKDLKNKPSSVRKDSMVWELDQEQLRFIEEYDAKVGKKNGTKMPEFHGDITKSSDVDAYLYAMEQYEKETTLVEYNGRYITEEELDDIKIKEMLEKNGYNLRNLYDNRERAKRIDKAKANDRKRIRQLRKMLAAVQERSEKLDSGVYADIDSKKGKKKNGKKKKKKKIEKVIFDAASPEDENMKSYEKRMKKMEWGDD